MSNIAEDPKYGSVTVEGATFHPGEPVMLFRAQDKTLLDLIDAYAKIAEAAGASPPHLSQIMNTRERVREWQEQHPELVKVPDSK